MIAWRGLMGIAALHPSYGLFRRTERHPVRDCNRWPGIRDRRADGHARRTAGAVTISRAAAEGDRGGPEADRVMGRVGWVERKRYPSSRRAFLPFAEHITTMREIAGPVLGINSELHHAVKRRMRLFEIRSPVGRRREKFVLINRQRVAKPRRPRELSRPRGDDRAGPPSPRS
jgi:hypothetical protein